MKIFMFNIDFDLIVFVKMGNKKQNQSIALFFVWDACRNLLCKGHKLEGL